MWKKLLKGEVYVCVRMNASGDELEKRELLAGENKGGDVWW